jgi:hypothetical protein
MGKVIGLSVLALALFGCQPVARDEPPRPDLRIAPEQCDLVRPGMTAAEVEAAIGGPPGFYEGTVGVSYVPGTGPRSYKTDQSWSGRRGTVEVQFDKAGKATKATWHPAQDAWLR